VTNELYTFSFIDSKGRPADISTLPIDYLLSYIDFKVNENECFVTPVPVKLSIVNSQIEFYAKANCEGNWTYDGTNKKQFTKSANEVFFAYTSSTKFEVNSPIDFKVYD